MSQQKNIVFCYSIKLYFPTDLDDLVLDSMSQVSSEGMGTLWQCNHCGKQDKDKNNMRRHVESHFSFSHTCPYCAKVYKSRPSLKYHMSTKHKAGL